MVYRGYTVTVNEAPSFKNETYVVNGGGVMVYRASSNVGVSYALSGPDAVVGAQSQIDDFLASLDSKVNAG